MPKRKADKTIEEWLEEGVVASGASRSLTEDHNLQITQSNLPTAESSWTAKAADSPTESSRPKATPVHVGTSVDEVANTVAAPQQAEVAADSTSLTEGPVTGPEEAAEWFWALLAQAGYDCW